MKVGAYIGNPARAPSRAEVPTRQENPSHFPGSNKTWSRSDCGDRKIKRGELDKAPSPEREGLSFEFESTSILLCGKSGIKKIASSFQSSLNPVSIYIQKRKKQHFHHRENPRWSYKHTKWDLFKVGGCLALKCVDVCNFLDAQSDLPLL